MSEIGRAEWIGTTARELIARRDCIGRVLAVVKGAVYLQANPHPWLWQSAPQSPPLSSSGEGEILWLAQNNLPMHPRAIRGDFDFGALSVGMIFRSDGEYLRFGDPSIIRFVDARLWQPGTIDPARVAPREVLIARIKDLTGFAQAPVRSDLHSLIGLGAGLTPSGDDFVGGLLFAQWYLYKAYPETITWDQRAVDDLIEYARLRTNVISHAILRDHANGQSVEPLHRFIVALLQGEEVDEMMTHVQNLVVIGNTSGCDMLAGVMTSMLLLESTH